MGVDINKRKKCIQRIKRVNFRNFKKRQDATRYLMDEMFMNKGISSAKLYKLIGIARNTFHKFLFERKDITFEPLILMNRFILEQYLRHNLIEEAERSNVIGHG